MQEWALIRVSSQDFDENICTYIEIKEKKQEKVSTKGFYLKFISDNEKLPCAPLFMVHLCSAKTAPMLLLQSGSRGRNGARTRCWEGGWVAGRTCEFDYAGIYSDSFTSGDFSKLLALSRNCNSKKKTLACDFFVMLREFLFYYKQLYSSVCFY